MPKAKAPAEQAQEALPSLQLAPSTPLLTTHVNAHGQRLEKGRQQMQGQGLKGAAAGLRQSAHGVACLPGHCRTPLLQLQGRAGMLPG